MPSRRRPTPTKTRRRPAKRRVRRVIPWSQILWLLLVLNVTAGLLFSPLTAASRVRVVGAHEDDRERLTQEIQGIRGQPCLTADRRGLEALIGRASDMKSVEFALNLFGRGLIKMEYRQPIARIEGKNGELLDETGNLFASNETVPDLPSLVLPAIASTPAAGLVSGWDAGRVAELCKSLKTKLPNVRWRVVLDDRSVISLTGNKMPRIVLGSTDDLEKKIDRLASIVTEQPRLLETAKEINLTAPDMPVSK